MLYYTIYFLSIFRMRLHGDDWMNLRNNAYFNYSPEKKSTGNFQINGLKSEADHF